MKILIVGAGPIGCYTAKLLQYYNFSPLIIEEHAQVGLPVQCAGIVGRQVFENTLLPISTESIINQIDGAKIVYNGDSIDLHRKSVAFVIDRYSFDRKLSEGLDILYETKFLQLKPHFSKYLVKTTRGTFLADIVIGADGPNSAVRRAAGIPSNIKYHKGIQIRLKTKIDKKNFIQLHIRRPSFVWLIPEDDKVLRIGIISKEPNKDLANFLSQNNIKGQLIDELSGVIPLGVSELVEGNIAVVGDAAAQVKPLTSGGIFYGLKAAEILSTAIKNNNILLYKEKWKQKFLKEIKFALRMRRAFELMSNEEFETVFDTCKRVLKLIEQIADFEYHSLTLRKLLYVFRKSGDILTWSKLWNIATAYFPKFKV